MDRDTSYRGQVLYETNLLNMSRYAFEALGLFARDVLGATTVFSGLACTATSPASLAVNIGPGRIYSLQNLDDSVWGQLVGTGGLAADINADHKIMKQGLFRDTTAFPLTPPATVGQSIVYLIQAQFQEADDAPVTTQFYNSTNPSAPITNSVSQARRDKCIVASKAGTAATTGSQVAPTADAGWIPLWVVTIAYGATTIVTGNIAAAVGAPVITIGGGGGGGGTALPAWQTVAAAYNINTAAKDRLICKTTGGPFSITLPAAPAFGEECWIAGNFATNNLTILRNGKTIGGSATDWVMNADNAGLHIVYVGGNDWQVFRG
jgi:hypothetical protein